MSDRLLAATRKGLFTIRRGSGARGTWSIDHAAFLGDNCSAVLHDPRDDSLYAALDHGHFGCKLHRSDDAGATFTEITCPSYPEMPADDTPKPNPMSLTREPIPWSLKLIWALVPGGPEQPGRLWCGTLPGGLFRSDDRGESWSLNRPLWDMPERELWFGGGYDTPGIHSVCVDPRDPTHLTVGVSCGGVWQSRDDGESWTSRAKGMRAEYMPPERAEEEAIQDPHLIDRCRDHPDTLWVQHHNGIFRSTDGAASWQEIRDVEPSTFGFAVAAHPADPGTAWFIPAIKDEKRIPVGGKLVVTRTTDGGGSFQQLTKGLPQEHGYDLVFRHALDVDETGERLAFGSTTGTLWISERGGESWEPISHHLPPIYAVHFA